MTYSPPFPCFGAPTSSFAHTPNPYHDTTNSYDASAQQAIDAAIQAHLNDMSNDTGDMSRYGGF